MRVDIVNLVGQRITVKPGQCQFHTAHRTFTRWCHHVITIRIGAIANKLGIDFSAACQRMIHIFKHHHAATAGNDKPVPVSVIGAGCCFWRVIIFR